MSHTFTPRTPEELDLCLRMLIEAKVSYDISLEEEKDEDESHEDFAPSVESLYDENDISRISLSEIDLDTSLIDQIADCNKKELISILDEFDSLMLSHRDDQYQDFEGNDHRLGEKGRFKYDIAGSPSFAASERTVLLAPINNKNLSKIILADI